MPTSWNFTRLRNIDWKNNWKWVTLGVGILFLLILLIVLALILSSDGGGDEFEAHHRVALNFHNARRKEHQSGPLELDPELNDKAFKCAEYYATILVGIDHSCKDKGGARENLYSIPKSAMSKEAMAEDASSRWYAEVKFYDFDRPAADYRRNGHFTAMIWKASRKVGFGVYKSDTLSVVVALYKPPGNMGDSKYRENVLPKL